jgi:hypothetical protein
MKELMYTITLTVNLYMGIGKEDIEQNYEVKSLEQCFDLAYGWMGQDPEELGAQGISAKCTLSPEKRKS